MNFINKFVIILLISIVGNAALAQQKNSIEVSYGNYFLWYNHETDGQINTKGLNFSSISYNRAINSKLKLSFRIAVHELVAPWKIVDQNNKINLAGGHLGYYLLLDGPEDKGKIETRQNFSYWDLGIRYEIFKKKRHSIGASQYISLAHGTDVYIKKDALLNNVYDAHFLYNYQDPQKANYFGGVTGIDYKYSLWKGCIDVGAYGSARYYLQKFPFQINFGLLTAFNF